MGSSEEAYPGLPRWMKVVGVVVLVLALLVIAVLALGLGGEHGPMRHLGGDG